MNRKMKHLAFIVGILIASASMLSASGNAVYEQGTRAMGMANAFVAKAADPSAIWYNPAGITQLPGTQVYIGSSGLNHNPKISNTFFNDTFTTDNDILFNPHLYLTHQLSEKIWLGIGYSTPYNYQNNWGDGPPTFDNPVSNEASKVNFQSTVISPTLAYKFSNKFSVGLGVHFVQTNLCWTTWDNMGGLYSLFSGGAVSEGNLKYEYDLSENDITFFGGLQWKLSPKVIFGFNYQGGISSELEGRIDFTPSVSGIANVDSLVASVFPDQDLSAEISSMVDQFTFGLAVGLGERLELEADITLMQW